MNDVPETAVRPDHPHDGVESDPLPLAEAVYVESSRLVHPKVAAATLAVLVLTVVIAVLHWAGVNPPQEVVASVSALVAGVIGYLTPDA